MVWKVCEIWKSDGKRGPEGPKFCEILSHSVRYGMYVNLFHSNIQDDRHAGQLENLDTSSALEQWVGLSWNLFRGIDETWRFRTAKFVPFQHSRWLPCWPSWNPSDNISSQTLMLIQPKLDRKHWSDIEIQICKHHSDISDGPLGGHLENLQTSSAP